MITFQEILDLTCNDSVVIPPNVLNPRLSRLDKELTCSFYQTMHYSAFDLEISHIEYVIQILITNKIHLEHNPSFQRPQFYILGHNIHLKQDDLFQWCQFYIQVLKRANLYLEKKISPRSGRYSEKYRQRMDKIVELAYNIELITEISFEMIFQEIFPDTYDDKIAEAKLRFSRTPDPSLSAPSLPFRGTTKEGSSSTINYQANQPPPSPPTYEAYCRQLIIETEEVTNRAERLHQEALVFRRADSRKDTERPGGLARYQSLLIRPSEQPATSSLTRATRSEIHLPQRPQDQPPHPNLRGSSPHSPLLGRSPLNNGHKASSCFDNFRNFLCCGRRYSR